MITSDRIFHILAVARLMKEKCLNDKCDDKYIEDMFTLGYLHDIGYEFYENYNHNQEGGLFLERQNYKYYNEIKFHGTPNCNYSSKELDLLNWADMHIDGKGNYVSFEERLNDIATRRCLDSLAYKNSKIIIDELVQKGYK